MKVLVLACLVGLSVAASKSYEEHFLEFKNEFGKQYETAEEELERFQIFKSNTREVLEHNRQQLSYTRGINFFSDVTEEEFKSSYLGLKRFSTSTSSPNFSSATKSIKDLPNEVNWVKEGAVTSVKNQGQCGSCWAFCLTAQVESYAWIATGDLIELSTQQVTSCTPNTVQCGGTGGCMGSVTQLGFNYLQLFGSVTEADWPYVSGTTTNSEDCTYDLETITPVVGLTGYDSLPSNDEAAVMQHIAEVGPLAIAVDASNWSSYSGGVFDGCSFDENISINHGVQLVGYGSEFSPLGVYDYWLVRNSWGPNWGEDGYIKLLRTPLCGVNSTPMDGTACVGGPGNDQQKVCGMCGMLLDTTFPLGVHKN
eukprot:GFUD01035858.1.p1 GENE.GFUD01035858.1~~GFUD01035858.1.p1  ORF type:complete len:375 (+),score=110.48 GFUD01035858.1:27-1127(+)